MGAQGSSGFAHVLTSAVDWLVGLVRSHDLALQDREEQLDLVDPARMRRRVVRMPSGVRGEPRTRVLRAVTGSVVEHEVDLQHRVDSRVDLVEERAEVDGVVLAGDRLGEDLAAMHVERGEDAGGAVTDVHELSARQLAGAGGLVAVAAFLGLDRGLLIHREHQRPLRRVEIEAAHVADPVPEPGVIAAVQPAAYAGQVDIHGGEDPPHLRHRHLDPLGPQRVSDLEIGPGRDRISGVAFGSRDRRHLHASVVIQPARAAAARRVHEPVDTLVAAMDDNIPGGTLGRSSTAALLSTSNLLRRCSGAASFYVESVYLTTAAPGHQPVHQQGS